jgi:hypothetical protein
VSSSDGQSLLDIIPQLRHAAAASYFASLNTVEVEDAESLVDDELVYELAVGVRAN